MNQTQSLKPRRGRTKTVQGWDQDSFVIADNDGADFAPAADEQTDLSVQLTGNQ